MRTQIGIKTLFFRRTDANEQVHFLQRRQRTVYRIKRYVSHFFTHGIKYCLRTGMLMRGGHRPKYFPALVRYTQTVTAADGFKSRQTTG